ncbi:OmpA family protein [Rhodoferax sp.]|uniref:OmpA family protein n=1 Tax=Rhodoferax sp. TaxID=50421 RepID=UPI0025E13728|nr:OmpA family protein [Rhodoferax sp.]
MPPYTQLKTLPRIDSKIRRHLLGSAAIFTLAVLGACQSAPPAPALDPAAQRTAELVRLGFVRTEEGWEYPISGKILFDTASDAMDAESQAVTTSIGSALARLGIDHLRVEGHTDNVGSATFNQTLSLRRAEAVARALASQGLPIDGMEVRGWGKDRPVVANDTPAGRLQNRRVAVIVPAQ